MNHLREFIDCLDGGRVITELSENELSEEREAALIRVLKRNTDSAICFFGEIDSLSGMKPIRDLCENFPFESTWFEFNVVRDDGGVSVLCLLALQEEEQQVVIAIRRHRGKWIVISYGISDGANIFGAGDGDFVADTFSLVRTYITAMRCNNVVKFEHQPPDKLQKARANRGKKPLFSYWTLELKQERTEGDSLGGTHASPRLHLRRGHPRQYAPGKYTWVQPCVVGNKSAGMVHKDYRLSA